MVILAGYAAVATIRPDRVPWLRPRLTAQARSLNVENDNLRREVADAEAETLNANVFVRRLQRDNTRLEIALLSQSLRRAHLDAVQVGAFQGSSIVISGTVRSRDEKLKVENMAAALGIKLRYNYIRVEGQPE